MKDKSVALPTRLLSKKKAPLTQEDIYFGGSFFALAENVPDVICRFDRTFRHLYVNPAIEKVTGMPPKHFIGKSTGEIGMSPEFALFWNEKISYVFKTKKQVTFDFDFPGEAEVRYFQSYVVPEFDTDGKVRTVLSISRDITDIRRVELEKETFIAMVTHELKTPVTSVKAFTQLLGRRAKKTDKRHVQYLARMDSQLDRLNKMIGDLLDITRIGRGKLDISEGPFVFHALVDEVVDELKKTAPTHTFLFKRSGKVTVHADKERIRQVLLNLLSNAVKYTPEKSDITIMIEKKNDELLCCVQDQGPGIPIEKQAYLFQRFSRLSKITHPDSPGLGLGLYISSEIIKQSRGKIWVESEKGKGSTFCFTLPLKAKRVN